MGVILLLLILTNVRTIWLSKDIHHQHSLLLSVNTCRKNVVAIGESIEVPFKAGYTERQEKKGHAREM